LRLFLAEKPSLARAIADALPGPVQKQRDHIRCGSDDVVAWCAGHILETAPPDAYDEKYARWALEHLPIVPREWHLRPSAPDLLAAIARLLKHAARVVHAGDPDREGQLLVDEVLAFLGYRGPVDRLLLRDLSPAAVHRQLGALEPNAKYRPLSDAALARQRADWLYGMNMTRLYTLLGRQAGYDGVLSVGRVQTPVLGLIVRRDRAIETFIPKPYFIVSATVATTSGATFSTHWVPGPQHAVHLDEDGRLLARDVAEAVATATSGATGRLRTRAEKPHREAPPLPYSLADLQVDAGKRLGLSAQQTLDACQSLYETHQLITYPRSDCRYLPSEHHAQACPVLEAVAFQLPNLAPLTVRGELSLRSKAWDDTKVTAHHAIVPTPTQRDTPRRLSPTEAAVYDLVARRYLAQFFPAFEYVQTELSLELAAYLFRVTGRRVVAPGWKAVLSTSESEPDTDTSKADQSKPDPPDNASLPDVSLGDAVKALEATVVPKKTEPPEAFTDASLMQAMCGVAKFVTDPAIHKILSDTDGIGTPATRAAIVETLFERGYVERRKKAIVSTPTGRSLIDTLPPVATTPDMTAVWEAGMRAILEGQQPLGAFLRCIETQLRQLVEQAKARGPIAALQSARASTCAAGANGSRGSASEARRAGRAAPRRTPSKLRPSRRSGQ